jgi:hypothetical protein
MIGIDDYDRYPYLDHGFSSNGFYMRKFTRWDVARNCFSRALYYGTRNPADEFITEEMDTAMRLMGLSA